MKITKISYSQTTQYKPFYPVNILAEAEINENENLELAMNDLKLFVINELKAASSQLLESEKPVKEVKKQEPIVANGSKDFFPDDLPF